MGARRSGDELDVVLLMSDEQSWDTLGCHGNPAASTPHLDALAADALDLERCYTPFPLCCPSRTSILTSLMPRHHDVLGNWRGVRPDLREVGLGADFAEAGYHTTYVGKWHVPGTTPAAMGFADTAAIPAVLNGKDRGRYIEPYRHHLRELGYDLDPHHIENLTPADIATLADPASPYRGTASIPLEHYLETWQTDQFLAAVDRAPQDRPWFAVCSYNAPHFPLLPPAPFDRVVARDRVRLPPSWYTGTSTLPREVRESAYARRFAALDEQGWVDAVAHYWGLCSLFDHQVGRILAGLSARGRLDRTLVVVTSDHGDMMGAHRLVEKGHLLHYEEALRVPMLLRHPDGSSGTSAALASMVDLGPTLLELAGAAPTGRPHDGASFAHLLSRPAAGHREWVQSESVLWDLDSEDAHGEHRPPQEFDPTTDAVNLSARTADHHYVYRSRDVDELYDMATDPGQTVNVAASPAYAPVRAALRTRLADSVGDVFTWAADQLRAAPAPGRGPAREGSGRAGR